MKAVRYLMIAAIAMAALKAIAAALALAIILALVVGVLTRPKETIGFLAFLLIVGVVKAHPLACLGVLAVGLITGSLSRSSQRNELVKTTRSNPCTGQNKTRI